MRRVRQVRGSMRPRVRLTEAGVILLTVGLALVGLPPSPALAAADANVEVSAGADRASEAVVGPAAAPVEAVPASAPEPEPAPASAPALNFTPALPTEAPPSRPPLLERWWFWSAVAAVGITAFVIVAATSLSNPGAPSTELGNRVAF